MLKQDVENLTELDKSAELLVRLLCAVPGWNEKNVQVCTDHFWFSKKYFLIEVMHILYETGSTTSYRGHHLHCLNCEEVPKAMCCSMPSWYELLLLQFDNI